MSSRVLQYFRWRWLVFVLLRGILQRIHRLGFMYGLSCWDIQLEHGFYECIIL
jgi:hypothetical protein